MIDLDFSFFVQFVNFIITLLVLNILLFGPIRAVIKKRGELMAEKLGKVEQFKLALVLTGRPKPLLVDVHVPNNLSFDRQICSDIVHEYLLEAGFMQLPQAEQKAA